MPASSELSCRGSEDNSAAISGPSLAHLLLQMKFPERLLRVKAASPREADKWHTALERALKEKQQGPGTPHQRAVESIKKVIGLGCLH